MKGLDAEANAFDVQIEERIRNGHIPDLRRAPACDWFYNLRLARFLREMDRRLVALDVLDASLFFFVGRVV